MYCSVATPFGCDGIFSDQLIANLLQNIGNPLKILKIGEYIFDAV